MCSVFSVLMVTEENRERLKEEEIRAISMQLSFKFLQNITWIFFLFPVFLIFSSSSATRSSEIKLICGSPKDNLNSTITTAFVSNFVKVMESIQQQVSRNKWGSASITSPSPQVYGLAQCHSDLSSLDCQLCFSLGRIKLPRCVPKSAGRIYLDGCFLRYDSYSFFNESVNSKYDAVNCSQPTGDLIDNSLHMEFSKKVADIIKNVTDRALQNGTFATVEAKGGVAPAYALAQCWNSLTYAHCRDCLVKAGSQLRECAPSSQGQALFTGCYMRYSTEKFFKTTSKSKHQGFDNGIIGAIVLAAIAFLVLASFGAFIGYRRLSTEKEDLTVRRRFSAMSNLNFKYEVLEKATNYFSDEMKLGQGGAGSVFKGNLTDGRIVAVKRLVYNTRQWVDQFFNEVNLISGIQHKNLVRLLGCSIEGPESLLVYEYVPNRSLDQILFAKDTVNILSWPQRYNIILGTAEGLAYLHGGSGVKIIHRDIKTSNILLDEKLTPKIADFGLARCFTADNTHISTGIAGTLGYMAPEYLIRGQLTEKADVYGFGVLVLEIATGKKNSVYSQGSSSILHSVWRHYKAKRIIEAIDPKLRDILPCKEAEIVLQLGLLCTQASASLRPTMAEIIQMLTDKECQMPSPKQPPFLNASILSADDFTENSITKVPLTRTSSITVNPQMVAPSPSIDTQHSLVTATPGWSPVEQSKPK